MRKLIAALFITGFLISCGSDQAGKPADITLTPLAIGSPADSASAEPYLFTDKNGIVYLSWIAKEGQNSTLKYSSLHNGKWNEPAVIAAGNDWFVNWADYPVIATDGSNNMISHFLQKSE